MDQLNLPVVLTAAAIASAVLFAYLRKGKKQTVSTDNNQQKNIEITVPDTLGKPKQNQDAESPTKTKKSKPKKKKQPKENQQQISSIKTQKQIEQVYAQIFYGTINLKPQQNSIHGPTCVAYKNSKILVGTTKNQLVLYDLKKWKKEDPKSLEKYFVSLDNNTPTAVYIGTKYYYVALGFDKTIVYYEFVGQKGVYFQEVKKFYRNILKSDASAIYVPESEKFIITAGSQADTTLNVWSMKGEKIHTFNTYQIQHYDIRSAQKFIMVRGWTSEVKLFTVETDKTGGFKSIEKAQHLSIPDQPLSSSIDNFALYGLTVSKQFKIILWDLNPSNPAKSQLKVSQHYEIDMDEIELCLIHTLKNENERYKTFVIFADKNRIVICDKNFTVLQTINGVECKSMQMVGSMKNAVLITQTKQDKLVVWNLTKIVEKMQEYAL